MSNKVLQNYSQLAAAIGFNYDVVNNTFYGQRNGYEFLIYAADVRYPYLLTVTTSARSANCIIGKAENKLFKKGVKPVGSLTQKDSQITAAMKNYAKQETLCANVNFVLDALSAFLRERYYTPCCQVCGANVPTAGFTVGKARLHLCQNCAERVRSDNEIRNQANAQRSGNLIGGIVGALLGSLVGVLCIVVFNQLGYVASVSGVIMAVCTFKCYEKLGGKLNKLGTVICCVMMIFMTYFGNRLNGAIEIAGTIDMNFFQAFRAIPAFITYGRISSSAYYTNLAMLYLFMLLGAVPTVMSIVRNNDTQNYFGQIGGINPINNMTQYNNTNNTNNYNNFQ